MIGQPPLSLRPSPQRRPGEATSMANKDQRRGNRETRKPKQPKAKPSIQASTLAPKSGKLGLGPGAKK